MKRPSEQNDSARAGGIARTGARRCAQSHAAGGRYSEDRRSMGALLLTLGHGKRKRLGRGSGRAASRSRGEGHLVRGDGGMPCAAVCQVTRAVSRFFSERSDTGRNRSAGRNDRSTAKTTKWEDEGRGSHPPRTPENSAMTAGSRLSCSGSRSPCDTPGPGTRSLARRR